MASRAGLLAAAIALLCLASCHAIQVRDLTIQDEIEQTRLGIYRAVLRQIALYKSTDLPPDTVLPVEPTLPDYQSMEIVQVNLATLLSQGYTFNEFTLPPGLKIDTTSPTVLLIYQKTAVFVSPFLPPLGSVYVPYVLALDIIASVDANVQVQNVQSVPVTATAENPILVTFNKPKYPGVPVCTQFTDNGLAFNITTDIGADSVQCSALSVSEYTLSINQTRDLPPGFIPPPPVSPTTPSTPSSPSTPSTPSTPSPPNPPGTPSTEPPTPGTPPSPGQVTPSPPDGTTTTTQGSSTNTTLVLALGVGIPLAFLAVLAAYFGYMRCHRAVLERKFDQVEFKATNLETALIAGSRAPTAGATRTRAQLQDEFFTEGM